MASVTFDQFLPDIQPEAPGVPYPVLVNAIRNACFDFCRKSLIWNEFQTPAAYTQGSPEYQLTPPTDAQVVQVLSLVLDDGRTLYPGSLDDTVKARPQWRTAEGVIEWFVQSAPDTFRFVAVPNSSGTFTPQVAYAPLRTATTVDSQLFNLYLEDVKHGALWKIKSMAGAPWTDPAAAAASHDLFQQGIGKAISERTRSNSRATLRVSPVSFM